MANSVVLVLMFAIACLQLANSSRIILNENDLLGICHGRCSTIPALYNRHGCQKISDCRTSSAGWIRWFVQCDYCNCECESQSEEEDILIERGHISATEVDLFGQCMHSCVKPGLVRTNFQNCERVENCVLARRTLSTCDFCTCECVNNRDATSYRLKNVTYDLGAADLMEGQPMTLLQTILENSGEQPQTVTRVMTYTHTRTSTLSSSYRMQVGLTATVEASATVHGTGVKSTLSRSLQLGYTTTAGSSETVSESDQIRASVTVPAFSTISATIIGHVLEINVPYHAVLEITYQDGTTRTRDVSGVFTNVSTGQYRVQYSAAEPVTGK